MMIAVLIGLAVVAAVVFKALSGGKTFEKPAHFRDAIAAGSFRLVAVDEMGGAELARSLGDFGSFEAARKEAAAARADSELKVGHKGQPTKFFIYNHAEELVGDWNGPKATPGL